jgi:hypothetical protein
LSKGIRRWAEHSAYAVEACAAISRATVNLRMEARVPYFDDIAQVIAEHAPTLRSTGALAARPGRRLDDDGYPTAERVIVLLFPAGAQTDHDVTRIGGFAIDSRTASAVQTDQLRDPSAFAVRTLGWPDELVPSRFPGQLSFAGTASGEATKPKLPYTPPAGVNLDPLPTGAVTMICSVSPDNGWVVLESFLTQTQTALTVAMYDFTSAHIEQAVATALHGKSFELVLDNPAKDASADQTDEQTVALLTTALGSTFRQQWALTPQNPDHATPIFDSAYHIKVAVRDTGTPNSAVWISSGNWDNSNQPIFDPTAPDVSVAEKSDRDWHIIIFNDALATTFKAYIDHDFSVAATQNASGAAAAVKTATPLATTSAPVTTPVFTSFVQATTITGETTITPLLTPDPGIYVERITALFTAAATSIDLQYQYITSFSGAGDESFAAMIDALAAAEARGVAIRMIYSEFQQQSILELLAEAKLAIDHDHVRIQNNCHNKGILIDGHITVVSSQNWSGPGVLRNRDAGVIIDNPDVNAYYLARFNYDWQTLATGTPAGSKSSAVA